MLLIHGRYHWARTLLAFRNDYCLSCAAPRLAYLHRTFDVFHVFFVPILPLGFWKRWLCGTCGASPHVRITSSRAIKWAGIVLLIVGAAVMWSAPATSAKPGDDDPVMIWTFRIGLPVAAMFAIRHTLKAKPPERLEEKLQSIAPNRDGTCPRCATTLTVAAPWYRCGTCGLERRALPTTT